jgi:uncharacterized protein
VILIDSNVPMYLVGAEHPSKHKARLALAQAIAEKQVLVTDAEVLQEILHRYTAVNRPDAIGPTFEALLEVVREVLPIELVDVQRARRLLGGPANLSARDALHVAIMQRHDVDEIMSFDRAFDAVPGIRRIAE